MLDHYLHTACTAACCWTRTWPRSSRSAPARGCPRRAGDREEALAWFAAEHAGARWPPSLAAGAGFDTHTWQLAWALSMFLLRRGAWDEQPWSSKSRWRRRGRAATWPARRTRCTAWPPATPGSAATTRPGLVSARRCELFAEVGDPASQAHIHSSMTLLAERSSGRADALEHSLRALDLFRSAGHRAGQALVLNDVGWGHALLGNYQQALTYCHGRCRDPRARRAALGGRHLGQPRLHPPQARRSPGRALLPAGPSLYRELADRYNEADTLDHLGDAGCRWGTGRRLPGLAPGPAIFEEIGHPDSERVRAKLRAHSGPPAWISLTPHGGDQAVLRPCG